MDKRRLQSCVGRSHAGCGNYSSFISSRERHSGTANLLLPSPVCPYRLAAFAMPSSSVAYNSLTTICLVGFSPPLPPPSSSSFSLTGCSSLTALDWCVFLKTIPHHYYFRCSTCFTPVSFEQSRPTRAGHLTRAQVALLPFPRSSLSRAVSTVPADSCSAAHGLMRLSDAFSCPIRFPLLTFLFQPFFLVFYLYRNSQCTHFYNPLCETLCRVNHNCL